MSSSLTQLVGIGLGDLAAWDGVGWVNMPAAFSPREHVAQHDTLEATLWHDHLCFRAISKQTLSSKPWCNRGYTYWSRHLLRWQGEADELPSGIRVKGMGVSQNWGYLIGGPHHKC